MVSLLLTGITLVVCFAIFLRLFTFRRGALRFRRGMSCGAYAVMASAGSAVIYIVVGDLRIPTQAWPLVIQLGAFAWAVLRSHGNLAGVLRPEPAVWTGVERRSQAVVRDE